jgi:hypothetical protein
MVILYYVLDDWKMINGQNNLKKDNHYAYIFVIANMGFYVVSILFLLYASIFTTVQNYNKIRIYRINLIMAIFLFGCWGLSIVYGKRMALIKWYPKYKNTYLLIMIMAWLRTFFIFMLALAFIIFGLYYFVYRRAF